MAALLAIQARPVFGRRRYCRVGCSDDAEVSDLRVSSEADRALVASAARTALARLDVTAVRLGDVIRAGGSRSVVMHAVAERRSGEPVEVIIKLAIGPRDRFVRERTALSLAGDHGLPGTVRLLGYCDDAPLVVLEDLGDGPSVADLLLADDPVAAGQAVQDWASTVGALQAASAQLGDEFRARLREAGRVAVDGLEPSLPEPVDLLSGWLSDTTETMEALLRPLAVRPGTPALEELRAITWALGRPGSGAGLVPGDTCPDNALYRDGRLTLIDFEGAAHRHVAWEAAHLLVPWPTCWCSWALPDKVAHRALATWRQTVASAIAQVADDSFADDLARAVIAWVFVTMTFLLPHVIAEPETKPSHSSATSSVIRQRPDLRSLVIHRLEVVAAYSTTTVPALRDLAGQLHDACVHQWGQHQLELAPAFRGSQ